MESSDAFSSPIGDTREREACLLHPARSLLPRRGTPTATPSGNGGSLRTLRDLATDFPQNLKSKIV
ncbi:hypothetical protein FNW02_25810 [Komarekiella sp. 'clone 1']|uniref:Uncharacterized protein n=1 Tax=Komarekiella delphini-convector SJRDD-AB1 TaxID=2593771 RepID=A0AA40T202_9NOST|nr:hypothetical protein [Komarekiella delphini-convector SJRDD-AB1]